MMKRLFLILGLSLLLAALVDCAPPEQSATTGAMTSAFVQSEENTTPASTAASSLGASVSQSTAEGESAPASSAPVTTRRSGTVIELPRVEF